VIMITAVLLFLLGSAMRLTNRWTVRKWIGSLFLLGVGIGLAPFLGPERPLDWAIGGLGLGLLLIGGSWSIFRHGLGPIPALVGTMAVLSEVRTAALNLYSGALPGALLSILGIGVLTVWWCTELGQPETPEGPDPAATDETFLRSHSDNGAPSAEAAQL